MPRADSDGLHKSASGESGQAASESLKANGKQQPGKAAAKRQPRIPKLPMVRVDTSWYRARLLKCSTARVLIEITGFEDQQGPTWLPSNSDRIWRGSYKGKDWRYLGEGAWEPKASAVANRKRAASGNSALQTDLNQHRQRASSPEAGAITAGASSDGSGADCLESGGPASTRDVSPARSLPTSSIPLGSPSRSLGAVSMRPRSHTRSDSGSGRSTASTAGTAPTPQESGEHKAPPTQPTGELGGGEAAASTLTAAGQASGDLPALMGAQSPVRQEVEAGAPLTAMQAEPVHQPAPTVPAANEAGDEKRMPSTITSMDADARGTNAAPAILTAAPEADKASHSVQASGHANGGVRGDEHTSPARPSLQCKEALPADDKEQSDGLARLASLGSQQSPRASDSLKPKGHKRKRSSAPQRADPADLYPNDAPSPRQAPPLLAFSTAWRHASSSPEPEPAPEMTPAGTPSPRAPPAKRPARRTRAPAKIAGSPVEGEEDGDLDQVRPSKGHAAGLLGMFERQETDDELSDEAGLEADATHAPPTRKGRGGGRWGRGRGGRGRGGRGIQRQPAPSTPDLPSSDPGGAFPLPPASRRGKGPKAQRTGGGRRGGGQGGRGARDSSTPLSMDLRQRGLGTALGAQPFARLMQALDGLDEGQGVLLDGAAQGRQLAPALFNGQASEGRAGQAQVLEHMLAAQKGLSRILGARSEAFNGFTVSQALPRLPPPVPLFR